MILVDVTFSFSLIFKINIQALTTCEEENRIVFEIQMFKKLDLMHLLLPYALHSVTLRGCSKIDSFESWERNFPAELYSLISELEGKITAQVSTLFRTMEDNRLSRAVTDYRPMNQRFLIPSKNYAQQYSHLYTVRLAQMRKSLRYFWITTYQNVTVVLCFSFNGSVSPHGYLSMICVAVMFCWLVNR